MKLTQALVTRYAKFTALKNRLDEWLKAQRQEIMDALAAGAKCPEGGPYLLVLGEAEEWLDWKAAFCAHLRGEGKSELEISAVLRKIEDEPRRKVPRLYSRRNHNYRRKFEIRLPR